ncbi:MAG: PhnD/SsuA/transferrin family substrate-binding protein [Chloroflexota bacterium]
MRRLTSLTVAVALLITVALITAGCGEKPVTLGIVAVPGIDNLAEAVAPIAQAMAGSLKREVIPRVYMSYGQLIEGLGNGECDTAVVSPFAYAVAHDRYGANVILSGLRRGESELRYEFLTRPDTGIVVPIQMAGARVALAAAEGTAEQQYLLTFLARFGATAQVTSHADDQAALAALLGRTADIAAVTFGFRDRLRATVPDIDAQVQVVWISERIPFEAVAVAKASHVAPTELARAWTEIAGQTAFKSALRTLYGIDGLQAAVDADYGPAREAVAALGIKIR